MPADPLRHLVEEEPLPRGDAAQEGLDRGLGHPVALGVEAEQGVAEGEAAELKGKKSFFAQLSILLIFFAS